jgi:7,8-dihydropterin-6-yl-methyl-4-(beta-D-ribofuranosyl)aminobenzene 5'-phosphate synthase
MEVRITTLSENTATFGFLAEWGLSILVEANDKKILVDCGMSISAAHNAQILGVDLSSIDCIVLSHGHPDHTGGLREVLKITGEVEVIAHPDIWAEKYVQPGPDEIRYAGVPFVRTELEGLGARFNISKESVRVADNIMTTGEIPMQTAYEHIDDNILVKKNGILGPDPVADDNALIINTDFGLVVILGCAHRGIVNTLLHARRLTGNDQVFAAIGGIHLFRVSGDRIDQTIKDLREMGIVKLGVSHCTGFFALSRLAHEFKDTFFLNNAGMQFALP